MGARNEGGRSRPRTPAVGCLTTDEQVFAGREAALQKDGEMETKNERDLAERVAKLEDQLASMNRSIISLWNAVAPDGSTAPRAQPAARTPH